jgi:hypothetical protein
MNTVKAHTAVLTLDTLKPVYVHSINGDTAIVQNIGDYAALTGDCYHMPVTNLSNTSDAIKLYGRDFLYR